jgi:hypothetical protein
MGKHVYCLTIPLNIEMEGVVALMIALGTDAEALEAEI